MQGKGKEGRYDRHLEKRLRTNSKRPCHVDHGPVRRRKDYTGVCFFLSMAGHLAVLWYVPHEPV